PLLERRQPRHRLSDDQRVNVVRAFVRVHALEILHVSHRAVLREDTVATQQSPSLTRDVTCNVHVVALRKRNLLRREPSRILESPKMKREQSTLRDLRHHLGKPRLLQLKATYRATEHHSVAGVR